MPKRESLPKSFTKDWGCAQKNWRKPRNALWMVSRVKIMNPDITEIGEKQRLKNRAKRKSLLENQRMKPRFLKKKLNLKIALN